MSDPWSRKALPFLTSMVSSSTVRAGFADSAPPMTVMRTLVTPLGTVNAVVPDKDIQALEKNTKLHNKVKKTIDSFGEIQFKNEIFSIKKIR